MPPVYYMMLKSPLSNWLVVSLSKYEESSESRVAAPLLAACSNVVAEVLPGKGMAWRWRKFLPFTTLKIFSKSVPEVRGAVSKSPRNGNEAQFRVPGTSFIFEERGRRGTVAGTTAELVPRKEERRWEGDLDRRRNSSRCKISDIRKAKQRSKLRGKAERYC